MNVREQLLNPEPVNEGGRTSFYLRNPAKYFDSKPQLHIQEPVIASLIAMPRGSLGFFRMATEQASPAAGVGLAVAKIVGEEVIDKVQRYAKNKSIDVDEIKAPKANITSEVKLAGQMYMAVGPTRFGLFQLGGSFAPSLVARILLIPRTWISDFRFIGRKPLVFRICIEFADGTLLELEGGRLLKKKAEKVRSVLTGADLSSSNALR